MTHGGFNPTNIFRGHMVEWYCYIVLIGTWWQMHVFFVNCRSTRVHPQNGDGEVQNRTRVLIHDDTLGIFHLWWWIMLVKGKSNGNCRLSVVSLSVSLILRPPLFDPLHGISEERSGRFQMLEILRIDHQIVEIQNFEMVDDHRNFSWMLSQQRKKTSPF